jgi:hypothetical protein
VVGLNRRISIYICVGVNSTSLPYRVRLPVPSKTRRVTVAVNVIAALFLPVPVLSWEAEVLGSRSALEARLTERCLLPAPDDAARLVRQEARRPQVVVVIVVDYIILDGRLPGIFSTCALAYNLKADLKLLQPVLPRLLGQGMVGEAWRQRAVVRLCSLGYGMNVREVLDFYTSL